jgi:dihydrofolate reductase
MRGVSTVRVALIAAVARNGVIGRDGEMPWRLSTDLKRFKRLTMGKPVIMGRKTFEAIGKPLPGRTSIVVTRSPDFAADGAVVAPDLDTALSRAGEEAARMAATEVAVIGGGEIYAAMIDRADRLFITHVEATPEGDTRFPPIDPAVWRTVASERIDAGEKDSEATTFAEYERIPSAL